MLGLDLIGASAPPSSADSVASKAQSVLSKASGKKAGKIIAHAKKALAAAKSAKTKLSKATKKVKVKTRPQPPKVATSTTSTTARTAAQAPTRTPAAPVHAASRARMASHVMGLSALQQDALAQTAGTGSDSGGGMVMVLDTAVLQEIEQQMAVYGGALDDASQVLSLMDQLNTLLPQLQTAGLTDLYNQGQALATEASNYDPTNPTDLAQRGAQFISAAHAALGGAGASAGANVAGGPAVLAAIQAAQTAGNAAVQAGQQLMSVDQYTSQQVVTTGNAALTAAQQGQALAAGSDATSWLTTAQNATNAANAAAQQAQSLLAQGQGGYGGAAGGGDYGGGGGGGGFGGGGGSGDDGSGGDGSGDPEADSANEAQAIDSGAGTSDDYQFQNATPSADGAFDDGNDSGADQAPPNDSGFSEEYGTFDENYGVDQVTGLRGLDVVGASRGGLVGALTPSQETAMDQRVSQRAMQMAKLKQVPVTVANTLLKYGANAITQAVGLAKVANLPGDANRQGVVDKLAWHSARLKETNAAIDQMRALGPAAGAGDPDLQFYAPCEDLKAWVLTAFSEWDAAVEGAQAASDAWDELWAEIGRNLLALPKAVIDKAGSSLATVAWYAKATYWIGISAVLGVLGLLAWGASQGVKHRVSGA